MENFFRTAWGSADKLDRWFALFSVLTLAFALLSPAFGIVAYKISQRRDSLRNSAAEAAESARKLEVIQLNQKVADTAALAEGSVTKLALAETHLSRSQEELAAATKTAADASVGFAEAQAKIRELDKKGKKVVTVQLRSELILKSDKPLGSQANSTLMGENDVAFWYGANQPPIRFHADRSDQRQLDDNTQVVITDLQPDDPTSTSGMDLTALDQRGVIASNAIQNIRTWQKQGRTAIHWRWILMLNGAAFQLINSDVSADITSAPGSDQLINLSIPPNNQEPSKSYQALFE